MPIVPAPGKLRCRRVVSSRVAWVTCKLELEAADDGDVGAFTKNTEVSADGWMLGTHRTGLRHLEM